MGRMSGFRICGAAALVAVLLGILPTSASAAELTGPPDAAGKYLYCNVNVSSATIPGDTTSAWGIRAACQYGPTSHTFLNDSQSTITITADLPGVGLMNAQGGQASPTCNHITTMRPGAARFLYESGTGNCNGIRTSTVNNITPTNWRCKAGYLGDSNRNCGIATLAFGTTAVPDPPGDWWPGGGPNPDPLTAPTGLACSRRLEGTATMAGSFTASVPAHAGTTDAWSWAWGDGSVVTSGREVAHVFPSLPTMPQGGWTSTVTLTRTGDGTTVAAGPTTATCSLRVDFLNPDQPTPATTTQTPDDDDCPSGLGFLNPLALVRTLKCLFIPDQNPVAELGDAYSGSVLSVLTAPLQVVGGFLDVLHTGYLDGRYAEDGTERSGCGDGGVEAPLGSTGETFRVNPFDSCTGVGGTLAGAVHGGTSLAVYVGAVLFCAKALAAGFGIPWVVGGLGRKEAGED
jgi:hypothetical protein